jgi:DNA polymerase I-like protein with 3'-5' exonuclease and polymerase domains
MEGEKYMNRPLVTVNIPERQRVEFSLLNPKFTPPRPSPVIWTSGEEVDIGILADLLLQMKQSDILAIDTETRGTEYWLPGETEIIGMGLAWDIGYCYLPWNEMQFELKRDVIVVLREHRGLIAHNVYFDAGIISADSVWRLSNEQLVPDFHCCTFLTYSLIASEGYEGQRHGLKEAMIDVLKWDDSNESEMEEWLVMNGYVRGNGAGTGMSTDELLHRWKVSGSLKPDKSQMWRVPHCILGKYCALDVEATYLLYTKHLSPVIDYFSDGMYPYLDDYMYVVTQLIRQRMKGLSVDVEYLHRYFKDTSRELDEVSKKFKSDERVEHHLDAMWKAEFEKLVGEKPEQQWKKCPIKETAEPAKYTKSGDVSKNWLKWNERREMREKWIPEYTSHWLVWEKKVINFDWTLNLGSKDQLAELLYTRMEFIPDTFTEKDGKPSVSSKALRGCGDIGKMLISITEKQKELGFLSDLIDRTRDAPKVYPGFRTPGTCTGRLSSHSPNLQQIPKTKRYLDLFRADEGRVWIDCDFAAVEPTVLAEFSQDENLMRIYGEGMPANDIYLFVASMISRFKSSVKATGYDPFNPTKESLSRAKKECKHIRQICKGVKLAWDYGAGPPKIHTTLIQDGTDISLPEVEELVNELNQIFSGVKEFENRLRWEAKRNGGWILNGLDRPIAIARGSEKDTLNRFNQSTGHDLLIKYIPIYTRELTRRMIDWYPLIIDFHDASAVDVPESQLDETIEVYKWGLGELNRQLNGKIKLKGVPTWGKTLTDLKEPEE